MAKYLCPVCQKELVKGEYPQWVKWCVGPMFGQLLRPLRCIQHGEVDVRQLPADQQSSLATKKMLGTVCGVLLNVAIIALIVFFMVKK
jgi:large-conductance mechanosensitive channel